MVQVTLQQIRQMAERAKSSGLVRIIAHWSAGHYEQFFDDYDIQVDGYGNIWVTDFELEDVEAHCWRRNSDSIGVALCAAYKANTRCLGKEAPTLAQLRTLADVIREVCEGMEWPIDSEHALTHAEQATIDGYGPNSGDPETRWDLWFLRDGEEPGTGGEMLRMIARGELNV